MTDMSMERHGALRGLTTNVVTHDCAVLGMQHALVALRDRGAVDEAGGLIATFAESQSGRFIESAVDVQPDETGYTVVASSYRDASFISRGAANRHTWSGRKVGR
ncbi:hypothetical protein HDE77_002322 [Rhodanobacter sp. MP7CTX1]|nr:hypothetical protein [Rhodanobacter sp. MP7CTX1]